MMLQPITSSEGFLLVLSIIVPIGGILLAFVLGGRFVKLIAYVTILIGAIIVMDILIVLAQKQGNIVYLLGTWSPPLGVALRADGLSAVMLAATTTVIGAVAVYATADFSPVVTGN